MSFAHFLLYFCLRTERANHFSFLAIPGIKEETSKESNNKPHLPSIFVELCRAVFTACVYLIKSTPYFLLFNVRFGLKIDKKRVLQLFACWVILHVIVVC